MNNINIVNEDLNTEPRNIDKLRTISSSLKQIKKADSNIEQIGIAGGFIVDMLLNLTPNDLDLKYTYLVDGVKTKKCVCENIRQVVNKETKLSEIYEIDIGNIMESKICPHGNILEKHCGIFSHHMEYISMFVLDDNGNIWANPITLRDFNSRMWEPSYEGINFWSLFKDLAYFESQLWAVFRGFGYIVKRDLNIGEVGRILLSEVPYMIENLETPEDKKVGYRNYFYKKVKDLALVEKKLTEQHIQNAHEVVSSLDKFLI